MAPPQLKSKKPKKMKMKMKPQVLKIDANGGSVLKPALARRMSTLKKKASELSTLCDVAVCVVSVGADSEIETWPENQQDAKSILLKHKNLGKLGKKIEKGSFSARKEALNERIGVVMMRDGGTKARTTNTCSFMEFYENIMGTSVLPDPPDQQQTMLLVDQVPHHQQEDYSTTNSDGFYLDDLHIAAAAPTMSSIDDYVSWLMDDHNDIGLMKDYIQFCDSDLATLPLESQEQQMPLLQPAQMDTNNSDHLGWLLGGGDIATSD
ncbi:uncharacterized protein Pyn_30225 [Prunus yedoensis var. nudiflora]|uniref:MADS-box domain-containing protein n=1 Tax=Prunus yedoensis var. nudiflora TaxID=2094558 RepID=A0A314YNR1_PRUYE|nr:uncharacterized protein Pyn_30225 [Prunus yedoensis var. nudiflora]